MIVVSVMYGTQPDGHFDWDYYNAKHIPLVRDAYGPTGLETIQVLKGMDIPGGGPARYVAIALLGFTDMAAVQASMGGVRTAEVMGDIANFTNIEPLRQISELV
ncbi:MAG: EthD family reductase [Sphingomonas sp.]|nr:EthD family reductase [Sphingomonas sp.]